MTDNFSLSLIGRAAVWLLITALLAFFAWTALTHNIWVECWESGGKTIQGMAKGVVCQKTR
jgi:hypothetical protein